MSALSMTATGSGVALAVVALLVSQPEGQASTLMIQDPEQASLLAVSVAAEQVQIDQARGAAETARSEVPQVVAQREAAALAQRQAEADAQAQRQAEAEAAAQAKVKAEQVKAEQDAAARQSKSRQSDQPPAAAAKPSSRTADSGIGPSSYTGPMYDEGFEATRRCIVRKESTGNYGVVSRNGTYHGAYQFMRSTSDVVARRMGRAELAGTGASTWSRYDQDMAFWTLWNHGAGRGNWPTAHGC